MDPPTDDGAPRRWLIDPRAAPPGSIDRAISEHYLADEPPHVRFLIERASISDEQNMRVGALARSLVEAIRGKQRRAHGVDALLTEYDLSSAEGVVLMCLAEALLRIPDAATADRLIADKLGDADWHAHIGSSDSLFVNASTWALLLTGRILGASDVAEEPSRFVPRLVARLGEPVVRGALRQAMRILGQQFVMGETIDAALDRAARHPRYLHSFDMLGEAALTADDAERYFAAYSSAIDAAGRARKPNADLLEQPSISVKLSALHPRYEPNQAARAAGELAARLRALARAARAAGIGLTVDAEEADRLELSLHVFAAVYADAELRDYAGLGLAVQAYQKRAWHVLAWLERLAAAGRAAIPVRLVKGAYWDSEIKRAQELGLDGYPVFTRKCNTDVAYLACAKRLLHECPHLFPQFATHNAHTVAWLLEVGKERPFELQRLHGMGEELYGELLERPAFGRACRVYAPVGSHAHLLPYLVRRLLENGANTSFVNRLAQDGASVDEVTADPVATAAVLPQITHPKIPPPRALFAPARLNSRGWNLADPLAVSALKERLETTRPGTWRAAPRVNGRVLDGQALACRDPADRRRVVGSVIHADRETAAAALDGAYGAQPDWNATPAEDRARMLRAAADLYEADTAELVARCVAETGRTIPDALAELREAADLLRYYAAECDRLFASAVPLPGPTGERNELTLSGRGVFTCISPWNFPLAIFTGQIAAALAAGNTVIAKPAEQSPLTAARAIEWLYRAGIPERVLQFLPGDGALLGAALLADARVAGVAFTGSVATAHAINRTLANRDGALATLIAETGGVNALVADSSALAEQVVRDAAVSAFNSAGQRCSALRLLCLQEEVADEILRLIRGYLEELVIGDPALLATDVGPVIDEDAKRELEDYIASRRDRILFQRVLGPAHAHGLFVPPTVIELAEAGDLTREVFGPVLHVLRYRSRDVERLVDAINAAGYGLTLGVHTRIDGFAERLARRARVGNVYVNRNMIGAQVGVQPFGGMGLSGTGPKAGGPSYLPRFAVEQTVTVNTAAVGGNATLLSLGAENGTERST